MYLAGASSLQCCARGAGIRIGAGGRIDVSEHVAFPLFEGNAVIARIRPQHDGSLVQRTSSQGSPLASSSALMLLQREGWGLARII